MQNVVDVLIVGLGPTGATLAGLLGQRGVRVAAFDRLPGLFPQPRAIGLDHEGMRIMQELGLGERMAPYIAPYQPSEYLGVDGQLIKRLDTVPAPYPLGWAPNYVFNQPGFEGVLRQRLSELDTVQVHCEAEVLDAGQDSDVAWILVRHAGSAQPQRYTARYLVGCDGGGSPIRKRLGIELEDFGFDERWLCIDMLVPEALLADLPQTQVQYCDPARPCTHIIGPNNHRRWEIQLRPEDFPSGECTQAQAAEMLRPWLEPGQAQFWRSAIYRFHGLVAHAWRQGRCFLAGDAAHMTPPFMAQGMGQGLRDALNLAWKLARVIHGQSPEGLLDSYQQERRPHVVQTTRQAIELGRVICETDVERARVRDQRLRDEQGGVVKTAYRQQMIPSLTQGLFDFASPVGGQLFPQPVVNSDGVATKLDDLTGARLRVVVRGHLDAMTRRRYLDALRPGDGVLVCLDESVDPGDVLIVQEQHSLLRDWMQECSAMVVVVRPDHYVYGSATSHTDALTLLAQLVAQWQRSGISGAAQQSLSPD